MGRFSWRLDETDGENFETGCDARTQSRKGSLMEIVKSEKQKTTRIRKEEG